MISNLFIPNSHGHHFFLVEQLWTSKQFLKDEENLAHSFLAFSASLLLNTY